MDFVRTGVLLQVRVGNMFQAFVLAALPNKQSNHQISPNHMVNMHAMMGPSKAALLKWVGHEVQCVHLQDDSHPCQLHSRSVCQTCSRQAAIGTRIN